MEKKTVSVSLHLGEQKHLPKIGYIMKVKKIIQQMQ